MTTTPRTTGPVETARPQQAITRVRRNFWVLVAATILAVGVLTEALKAPNSPPAAAVLAVSGLAALASLTLAGRILTVTTTRRADAPRPATDPPPTRAPAREAVGYGPVEEATE